MKTNLKKLKQTKKLLQYLPEYKKLVQSLPKYKKSCSNPCHNTKKCCNPCHNTKKVVALLATIQAAVAENKSPAMESPPVKRKIQRNIKRHKKNGRRRLRRSKRELHTQDGFLTVPPLFQCQSEEKNMFSQGGAFSY